MLVPQLSAQLARNWVLYLRRSQFLGNPRSEYGGLIYSSVSNLGLRYNF